MFLLSSEDTYKHVTKWRGVQHWRYIIDKTLLFVRVWKIGLKEKTVTRYFSPRRRVAVYVLCPIYKYVTVRTCNLQLEKKTQNSTHSTRSSFLLLLLSCLFRLAGLFGIISLTELLILLLFGDHYFILFGKSVWQFYCRQKAELILALLYADCLFKGHGYSPLLRTLKRNKMQCNLRLIHSCLSCSNFCFHYAKSTLGVIYPLKRKRI